MYTCTHTYTNIVSKLANQLYICNMCMCIYLNFYKSITPLYLYLCIYISIYLYKAIVIIILMNENEDPHTHMYTYIYILYIYMHILTLV